MKNTNKIIYKLIPIFILLLFSFCSLCIGTKFISPFSIFTGTISKTDYAILIQLRLPRILISVLCGALLGGTGAVFQGFFRNPLADSGIMGISSGATLGAVLAGFISFSSFNFVSGISVFAFIGAMVSALCVYFISKIFKERSSVTLLLCGTALGTFFSAFASILVLIKQRDLHGYFAWTLGSFNAKGWPEFYLFIFPSVIALFFLQLSAKHLDVLVCGESSAIAFGLNYNFVRNWVLFSGALASSCAVCEGGIISFVGLIAPHIVRRIFGPKHKTLIFMSMIFGSLLLLVADGIARTIISPAEIPVGIITSLIGVPFFLITLCKKSGESK